jgi:putative ABC transport system ATP-binding protein
MREDPALAPAPVVEISHLNKSYRRGSQVLPVLQDISLTIRAGEFLALMGPSGSGKTTLLNLIAGLDRPDSGHLTVHGINLPALTESQLADWRAANVGFVFQFYQLIPVLTAFENVELQNHYPGQLSGGQQQRVAIARALVTDPTLIAADEPTGDLDQKSAGEIMNLLTRLNEDFHKTIIIVTHDPEAAAHASRIRRLIKGQLLNENEPQED